MLYQLLHPLVRQYVGAVLFTGVKLYRHLARDFAAYACDYLSQTLGRQVAGEVDYGFVAFALAVGYIVFSAAAGKLGCVHAKVLLVLICAHRIGHSPLRV